MYRRHRYKVVCAVVLLCRAGVAESAPSARDHFARGVELAQHGDFDDAAAEFQSAYQLSPNYAVLYNLGQAYAAMGQPIEAVRAFEQYLEGAGTKVSVARRHEVEELILINRRRIGFLSIAVEPPGSEVSIDGRSAGTSPLGKRMSLVVGSHSIRVDAPGHTPFVGEVKISPTEEATLRVELAASITVVKPPKIGLLSVGCKVPAASIQLDSNQPFDLEQAPIVVPVGPHEVTCNRHGYVSSRHYVEVAENVLTPVICDLRETPNLAANQTGNLSLLIDEPGAHIWIDGRISTPNLKLPAGPHHVLVRRDGFDDWAAMETVQPGFPLFIKVHLHPTPEHAQELHDAARSRRTWAYVLGGAGLALLGSGAIVYVRDSSSYAAWRRDHDALSQDIQNQRWSPTLSERAAELQSRSASIQGRDDFAIGTALVGGVLLSYAVASWLTTGR